MIDLVEKSLTRDFAQLDSLTKTWIVKAVVGAIVADGVVSPEERPHLYHLVKLLGDRERIRELLEDGLLAGRPPLLDPIDLDPADALAVFKVILHLCFCDMELHAKELLYIRELGKLLKIDKETQQSLLMSVMQEMRFKFFLSIQHELQRGESIWLGAAVLKLIMADGKVEKHELPYLNHIYALLQDAPDLLESLKASPQDIRLKELLSIEPSPGLTLKILRYLVEICLRPGGFEPQGLAVAREAAEALGVAPSLLKEIEDKARFLHHDQM